MNLPQGTILNNNYKVIQQLGKGAMGTVYLVRDRQMAEYAIKEILMYSDVPEEQKIAYETFNKEFLILTQLDHPNLPKLYSTFMESGKNYLVMDYVPGDSLEDKIKKYGGHLSEEVALDWIIQLGEVMDYLHTHFSGPIVYRDLKPANIIITPSFVVKLVDFGIARYYDPSKDTDTMRFGTPGYAAPEQFKGRGQSTPKSDIFGLGVILFEMLTGYDPTLKPFNFPPMKQLNPEISNRIEKIVKKATQLDPEKRYKSMEAFLDKLNEHRNSMKNRVKLPLTTAQLPEKKIEKNLPEEKVKKKEHTKKTSPSFPKKTEKKLGFSLLIFIISFSIIFFPMLSSCNAKLGPLAPDLVFSLFIIAFVISLLVFLGVYFGDLK